MVASAASGILIGRPMSELSTTEGRGSAGIGATPSLGHDPARERVIVPTKRRVHLRDLIVDRQIIRVLAARDLKVKYKQSLFGPLWLVFQPLALLAGFVVGFRGLTHVETAGIPYVVFALPGLSVWAFFQASMTIGTACVVSNNQYVRFTPCPRIAFPPAAIIASLPAFGITASGALVAAAVSGYLSIHVLLLPLAVVWLVALTLGIVWITSSLAVRYRDINNALPFFLQVGVFLAPVGYPIDGLSPEVRAIISLNPLTGVLEATRWTMLSGYPLSTGPIIVAAVTSVLIIVGGWRLFSRLETTMADDI
jgi:lipopolysaccharide transport system permease protein